MPSRGLRIAHIAYSSWVDHQLYVIRLADGAVRRLTDTPGGNACSSWFPDGPRLAFHSGRDGQAEVYVMSLDGTLVERLTNTPTHEFCPSVSPDGPTTSWKASVEGRCRARRS